MDVIEIMHRFLSLFDWRDTGTSAWSRSAFVRRCETSEFHVRPEGASASNHIAIVKFLMPEDTVASCIVVGYLCACRRPS